MSNTIEIDENLYDRQVRTYGLDAVKQMASSSVLLYGLEGGYATEIGKNLALGGIKYYLKYTSITSLKRTHLHHLDHYVRLVLLISTYIQIRCIFLY